MRTERLLQVTSALCVALGTILLGMGQHDLRMAVLAVIGAILAVWLNDILGIFRLHRWIASGAAFIASLAAFWKAFPINSLGSIVALVGLLVYLELILLFQKKNLKIYWELLVLSLLQVIVSALFSQGIQFGLLIFIYLFVALLDLALLNLHAESFRAAQRLAASKRSGTPPNTGETPASPIRVPVRRDLFRQVSRMGMMTVALTMFIFFILPRFGRPAWRGQMFSGQRQTIGFRNCIELGKLGTVVNNPTEVMRVKIINPHKPLLEPIKTQIYLHGISLNHYDDKIWYYYSPKQNTNFDDFLFSRTHRHFRSHFSRRRRRRGYYSFFSDLNLYRPPRIENKEVHLRPQGNHLPPGALLQDIIIEPLTHRELFEVRPYFSAKLVPEISYDSRGERLLRDPSKRGKRFSYQLFTTGISNNNQILYYPAQEEVKLSPLLEYPENIPTVVDTAQKWIEKHQFSHENPFAKAKLLNKQLCNPELFSYNLYARRSDTSIDPIEDFIKNNPEGHCEYFATALALMLRSQGIPARIVVGYKCDEYNSLGKFFRVRQLHTHSWVEAYFTAEDMGTNSFTEASFPDGLWYRFDPTPLSAAGAESTYKFLIPLARLINWFDEAWDNYVMEMDRTRQNTAIYKPIVNWLKATYQKIKDPQWWNDVWASAKPLLNPYNWNAQKWISWRGGLIGIAIMLAMLVLFRITRWIYRTINRRIRKIHQDREHRLRIEIEFYRRFLHVAARFGQTRRLGETPREFAHLVGPHIAENTENTDLQPLPSLITEAYYQVRFGRYPLDKNRQEEIELAVSQLEATTKK